MAKSRLEGYGTLLPTKWKEIYEHVEGEDLADRPRSGKATAGVPDQILGETLRIARLRIKELEAETNIQTTELNRLKEYVNASESAGRTMYGQQVDELKQTVAQHVAQMDYMRHAMKTKDGEIEVLKKKWQEYQEVQDRLSGYEKDRLGEKDLLRKRAEQIDALQHKVSSYEQHMSEAQAASFQALQDQLHSFQNEMAAASHLRTQLVDRDRQIDTIRHDSCRMTKPVACFVDHTVVHKSSEPVQRCTTVTWQMYNDEAGHAHSLAQQVQQANEATAAADNETRKALERVEAAKSEARDIKMSNMRLVDELQQARQESKELLIDNVRARDAAAREKAAAAESKEKEEELQASTSRLQKQIDKAVAERNSAEGRSQRSAASLLKVKADLAALEIKMQAKSEEVSHVQATWEHHENTMIDAQLQLADLKLVLEAAQKAEAEAQAAREAAEAQLAAQSSELDGARSRLAGAQAELDEVRSQVAKITAAHESVLQQLADSEQRHKERSEQLAETTASLQGKQAELSKLSQQHEGLLLQHERLQGELSAMTGALKAKQKEAEALQQSLELAEAAGQQERKTVAELQTELVGFKDRIRVAEGELAKNAPLIAQLNHANQNMGNRITALEQLKGELHEELFQQSVANTQLHTVNQNLTAQLAKAEEKNGSLEKSVASLNEERSKVQRESQVYESTLHKMNQQLQASLDLMAGEKAALQLSLAALQDQFEGVAQAVYTADEAVVDDELDRMRQQMAETASLLASAAYEQPQLQLQHYQMKLTEHLADPTQPLNLEMEGLDGEGQAAEAEPSLSAGRAQFSGLTDTPPRTPSQDAAGRAARAKRVASSREMAGQMKQLEQRLKALRAELREKENKARQAEGSVQDLKLQLDDLQTQTVSDRDAHDQEVEGLERKLTEAEREAAAANEKAAKLHEQLHGSTFHIKLAKEAMKKVRQAEAEVAAKAAAEAEALKTGAENMRLMLDLEDKGTQTDPSSKPGSPALQTPRRPMPTARNTVRQVPVPRPQQPIVKREPRPIPQARPPPNVHVATAAGDEVVEGLPPARTGLPQARPTLPPKRQPQNLMREIHVPTSLLKRRGPATAENVSGVSAHAIPDAAGGGAVLPDGSIAETAVAEAPMPATVPAGKAVNATTAAAAAYVKPTPASAQAATPPQLGIMAAGSHAACNPPTGNIRVPVSSHVASQPTASAKTGAAAPAVAGGGTAVLSMLGHSKHEPAGMVSKIVKPQAAAASGQSANTREAGMAETQASPLASIVKPGLPERVAMPTGETRDMDIAEASAHGGELRPVTALTDEPEAASTPGTSRLQTPQAAAAASAADFSQPQDRPSSSAESAQPEAASIEPGEQTRPVSTSSSSQASVSRPGTAEGLNPAQQVPDDVSWQQDSASDQVLQVHRAAVGRVHRHRAHPRPQSPIQTQISSVHGSAPGEKAQQAPAPAASGPAQHAQHSRSKKVPPLNMAVMQALKQQVSGLVPLDSRGSFKTARTVVQPTAPASQGALSSRLLTGTVFSKAESMTQLSPLTSKLQHKGSLPEVTPPSTTRASALPPTSHPQLQTAALLQSMLPGIVSAATPRQILPLDATLQLMRDVYDSKSVADLAALRQQVPCKPMQEFVQHYLQTRFGAGAGGSWQGAWHQLETAVKMHGADDRVAAFGVTCGLVQAAGGAQGGAATCAQVLYNGSQPLQEPPTTSAWAAAWLQNLKPTSDSPAGPSALIPLTPDAKAKLAASASQHPAVAEVLGGLAVIPGMQFVLQCTQGQAYARILARADLGVPVGPKQAPQLHRLLSEAANALGLEGAPHLFLQHSQQAALHYLELPVSTCLPGLAFSTPRQRAGVSAAAAAAAAVQQADVHSARTSLDSLSDAAVLQPAVVVTSRMIELLQPQELQALLVGCLSSGTVAGDASQPAGPQGQLVPSQPTVRQVALAASLAGLSGAALAEEVGDQLGMLWPTRLQPALLRALPYLALCTDRWTLQVMPNPEVLNAAILKVAAGMPELAASLTPDAFLKEAEVLQAVSDNKLGTTVKQESAHTFAAANNSLTVLRLREAKRASSK
ncbi:TPA: hypothetical protein ACH3X1_014983 [Trebouxia sp. C0004]